MAKILIIEDDANLALMLESFLLSQHYAVDIVSEGSEGLHQALYYPYDLIILDLGLPNTGGLEICREYRKSGGAAGIIMLTGKSHIKDKKAGLDTGADDYLTKPFEMEELAARVRALLRRPRDIKPDILTVRNISLNPA